MVQKAQKKGVVAQKITTKSKKGTKLVSEKKVKKKKGSIRSKNSYVKNNDRPKISPIPTEKNHPAARNVFALLFCIVLILRIRKYRHNEDFAVIIVSLIICIAILAIAYFFRSTTKKSKQKKLDKEFSEINNYVLHHFLRFMLVSAISLVFITLIVLFLFAQ